MHEVHFQEVVTCSIKASPRLNWFDMHLKDCLCLPINFRYFTSIELRELFALDDPMTSKTQRQLQEMHAGQRKTDVTLDEHIAFLHSLGKTQHSVKFHLNGQAFGMSKPTFWAKVELYIFFPFLCTLVWSKTVGYPNVVCLGFSCEKFKAPYQNGGGKFY